MTLSEKVHGDYKGFLIVETRYQWGHEIVAIPDEGETLRRKFMGFTRSEMLKAVKNLIDNQTEG